jgi:hypothetical protein
MNTCSSCSTRTLSALQVILLHLDMLRRSPRNHKNSSSEHKDKPLRAMAESSRCLEEVSIKKDFRPLLWQNSIPELSPNKINFPTPQLATTSYDEGPQSACSHGVIPSGGGSRSSVFVNWKVVLTRR